MKFLKFFSLLCFFGISTGQLFAQSDKFYQQKWKSVDSLDAKRLPESALKIVEEIKKRAVAEKNPDQIIKTTVYRMKFFASKEEDAYAKLLEEFEKETEKAEFPVKPVFQSMLAEIYWAYYRENQYFHGSRTETENFDKNDIRTWTLKEVMRRSYFHLNASLADESRLQATNLAQFHEVLGYKAGEKTRSERNLRPTLFDFVAHNAVKILLEHVAYSFETEKEPFSLNDGAFLDEPAVFASAKIASNDSLSAKRFILSLYQKLTQLHLKSASPDALLNLTFLRLSYVKDFGVMRNKDEIYRQTLEKIVEKYPDSPETALFWHGIADYYNQKGVSYGTTKNPEFRQLRNKALEICEATIKKFPETVGADRCLVLKSNITAKELNVQIESGVAPDSPFLGKVSYRNLKQGFFKIVKVNESEIRELYESYYEKRDKILQKLVAREAVQKKNTAFPEAENDRQTHTFLFNFDALPVGRYMIFAAEEDIFDRFQPEAQGVFYANFQVTALSPHVLSNHKEGGWKVRVLHRKTGSPLANVKVIVTKIWYEYKSGREKSENYFTGNTDAEGNLNVPYKEPGEREYPHYRFDYELGEDKILAQSDVYLSAASRQAAKISVINAFTDRAIYRPGQTVFFKAITFATDGKNAEVFAGKKVNIEFQDANYQKIAEQVLTTNEYGSVSGSFIAPKSGLLGVMRLIVRLEYNGNTALAYTTHEIRVEEYKRPKFEVKFEPLATAYRLNDKVEVTGKAVAYSGAAIDGAKVVFRVRRQAKISWWYARYYGGGTDSPAAEIENGTLTTDEKGNFKITFDALPDPNALKDAGYNFEITADVTDINGETHFNTTTIYLAKEAIFLSTNLQDEARSKDKKLTFSLSVKTANGTDENAKGKFALTRLISPENPVFPSKFAKPDVFVLEKSAFKKLFPYESYAGEEDFTAWEKGEKAAEGNFDSEKSKDITAQNLPAGVYLLEIETADRFGTLVTHKQFFTLFEEKSEKLPYPVLLSFASDKTSYEPGEKMTFTAASGLKDVNALFELYRGNILLLSKKITLNEKETNLEYTVVEEDRGGLTAMISFVRENRFYSEKRTLKVPFSNKDLSVTFETFRDKLQPGEKEQWKIKISGAKKEKVAAEMLATLYDASLDAFVKHAFSFAPYTTNSTSLDWTKSLFETKSLSVSRDWNIYRYSSKSYLYEGLNWFGWDFGSIFNPYRYEMYKASPTMAVSGYSVSRKKEKTRNGKGNQPEEAEEYALSEDESALAFRDEQTLNAEKNDDKGSDASKTTSPEPHQVRTNFNETAFFMPELKTDGEGNIYVNFTIPESLTKWALLGLAHTKDVQYKLFDKELQTQKTLMVVPNAPRFFRENDKIVFAAKITNLSSAPLEGFAKLQLLDAFSLQPVVNFNEAEAAQKFEGAVKFKAEAGQSTLVKWTFSVPENVQAITYRIYANAGGFSDGEEMTIPVLTNRMLVTETIPLPTRGGKKETFTFAKLKENKSSTLKHHQLTLEFTSAPAWYAIQALPYLMEYPYECSEQVFSRYYANALAAHIVNASPKIKSVFETWKSANSLELYSKLEQNQELKSAILEETPWVLEAAGETQRKKNVALLFDLAKMSSELKSALTKLEKKQHGNGGFSWFEGMKPSWYITQHILNGLAHLQYLGVMSQSEQKETAEKIMMNALSYCDNQLADAYEDLLRLAKQGKIKLEDDHLSHLAVQYLYADSFFKSRKISKRTENAKNYFTEQAQKYWTTRPLSVQALIALAAHRNGKSTTATDITKSMRERSLVSAEQGRYWKELTGRSYWWYDAPIETMALLIEAYAEIHKDVEFTDEMKTWLLKNKQTNAWGTTKATTEAVYALFLNPEKITSEQKLSFEALEPDENLEITVGKHSIKPNQGDVKTEAGTGYFKTSWKAEEISSDMGEITVHKPSKGAAWGGIYWQYFEHLDKITTAETPLKLSKKLFRVENTASGQVMKPIENGGALKTGDLVRVRIELRVDREMEYVHLKDMRASGFEPVNVLSRYRWQDGLGYYESTRDAATNFFIGDMPKGTYVFEYDLRANNAGNFSNGITTIQCMYAPEFSSHSEGIRVVIGE